MPATVKLIGHPEIRDELGELRRVRGHKSWGLLARVLLADRPLSRRELAWELFPDADDPLGSLRWCLAELRRALGSREAFSGDPVHANLPAGTVVDLELPGLGPVDGFDARGELLEGIEPRSGPEFESWLLVQRERLAGVIDARVRRSVLEALSFRHQARAMELAQVAVSRRPYDEGAHILLVKALVAAGRMEAAEQHVAATRELFRAELGVEPSSALQSATRPAVAEPALGVPARAVAQALLESGLAALDAGAVGAGVECLRRASAEAERSGDRSLWSITQLELGTALVHAVRGFDDEGSVLLRHATDLGLEVADLPIAARGLTELAYVEALVGRRPTATAYLEQAEELAAGDPQLITGIHAVAGFNLVDAGHLDEGIARFESSTELARSVPKPRREAWSLGIGARGHMLAGNLDLAETWLQSCLDVVADEQWIAFRPWPLALLGEVRLELGMDPGRVQADLEENFALSCQLGDPCWEGTTARVIALTRAEAGDADGALRWIAEAHTRCTRETDPYVGMVASILATEAELARRFGQPDRAERAARTLLSLAARTHMDAFVRRALDLLEVRGDPWPASEVASG